MKNIIFDIGNVLAEFSWRDFYVGFGYDEEMLERLAKATVKSSAWDEVDRGILSDAELIESFIRNAPSLEKDIRRIFQRPCYLVRKLDYAIPWIKSLQAAGYRCYYLSNFSRMAHMDCIGALDFLEHMDGGILSYQDKLIKPQTEIYQLLLDRYGLIAQESVFLDDTEKNLPPASALGIRTILFKNKEQAVEELEKLGVKI